MLHFKRNLQKNYDSVLFFFLICYKMIPITIYFWHLHWFIINALQETKEENNQKKKLIY